MSQVRIPYVHQFVDRHGKARFYFRRGKAPKVPLPGLPGSREFMAAYQAALDDCAVQATKLVGLERSPPGTMSDLIARYYRSPEFKRKLRPSTQATYRGILERFRTKHGQKSVRGIQREHVKAIVYKLQETPAAANNLLDRIRGLMKFAIDEGLRHDDPTIGIKKVPNVTDGFYTWSEDDIAKFEAAFVEGSRERLAFSLLLYTGQRRSDVVRMGRQHLRDGMLDVRQQKTGTALRIPLHAKLAAEIAHVPASQLTFLLTAQGRPFVAAGFTNWFRDRVRKAGLPNGCSPHGLRKACARRLAEAGCTTRQIMAITGHKSLEEVERYTRQVDQEALAREAIGRTN